MRLCRDIARNLVVGVALMVAGCAPVVIRPTQFDSTSTGTQVRSPADFALIPGMDLRFTTTARGAITVWFYGNVGQLEPFANTGLLFRLMVDGVEVIEGNRVRQDFIDGRRLATMVSFHWTLSELAIGDHRVQVEWIGITGPTRAPGSATIDTRTLTVAHGP